MQVVKIGGNELDDADFLEALSAAVASSADPVVLVHGGGKAIAEMQSRLGLETVKVDGLRVTDAQSLTVAQMVLSGHANKEIVVALLRAGVAAVGLSGVDGGLLRCEKKQHPTADLGFVGEIVDVNDGLLLQLMAQGLVPVISPMSLGKDGQVYNVNADEAAGAIAAALQADLITFVSNVPGVLDGEGKMIPRLTVAETEKLIADEIIAGGMIPKARAALEAIRRGVSQARITDVSHLLDGGGTAFVERLFCKVEHGDFLNGGGIMDAEAIIAAEQRYIVPTYVRAPMLLTHGQGARLFDSEGNDYLDFMSGIAVTALGHADAEWVEAVCDQAGRLTHVSNLFHTAPHAELARRLVEKSFADRVFFCNSGSEANETALKFARKYARRNGADNKTGIVAFSGGFHGRTMGALATTARKKYQEPFAPLVPGVTFAAFNDLDSAAAAVGDDVCAVIVEPIQGEGGIHPATADFLRGLRELCDRHGAVLIFDEVQCGLGRTGRLWAHERYGVAPDIMTLAKPLAGGLPIGAALVTEAVAGVIQPGDHGSTFAAGPLVCRAAQVVFDRVSRPAFLTEVRDKGRHLLARLNEIGSSKVTKVRGQGLLVGVELDRPVKPLLQAARERGLLVINAGENVMRLCPPLVISKDEIDSAVDVIAECLNEV